MEHDAQLNTRSFFVFLKPSVTVVYMLFTNADVHSLGTCTGKVLTLLNWTLEKGEQKELLATKLSFVSTRPIRTHLLSNVR